MDNFEKASHLKLRFETNQGLLSTEELFDLSLQSLDTIAKKVSKSLRDEEEESFIPNKSKVNSQNNLRLEILKHVIAGKVKEQDDRKARAERVATLSRLKELAESKTNEQFASQSLEDIQKQIAELEAVV